MVMSHEFLSGTEMVTATSEGSFESLANLMLSVGDPDIICTSMYFL